jgi:uncharacterized protein
MKLVDANVLIYAINSDASQHEQSRRWLERALSGAEPVGLTWHVILAFLRITTHRSIMERRLSAEQAIEFVDGWLAQPQVEVVVPGPGHWAVLRALMTASGTAGNLTSDAHLAALALEGGWTLVTTDEDFRRFPGVTVFNPIRD